MALRNQDLCSCCGIYHDPRYCSQCIAAGCNHRAKNSKCRQDSSTAALRKIPEAQLREAHAKLLAEHKQTREIVERLYRVVFRIDPQLLEGIQIPQDPASNGHAAQLPPAPMAKRQETNQGGISGRSS